MKWDAGLNCLQRTHFELKQMIDIRLLFVIHSYKNKHQIQVRALKRYIAHLLEAHGLNDLSFTKNKQMRKKAYLEFYSVLP